MSAASQKQQRKDFLLFYGLHEGEAAVTASAFGSEATWKSMS